MSNYESIVLFSPELSTEEVEQDLAKARVLIEKSNGTVSAVDQWGKRRTAYPVDRHREGYYVVIQFSAPPAAILGLRKSFRVNAHVLRHLIVKIEHPAGVKRTVPEKKDKEVVSDASKQTA